MEVQRSILAVQRWLLRQRQILAKLVVAAIVPESCFTKIIRLSGEILSCSYGTLSIAPEFSLCHTGF